MEKKNEIQRPDIMIYMSDQHGADYCSWGRTPVDTPVLDEMRKDGVSFEAAYTACPLCVPARMSMMSSLLPSHTGVYENSYTLSNLTPCFTHALVEAGYETVLIGRMHFIGRDQRHGFTKRLASDITPVSWKKPFKKIVEERGKTVSAFSSRGAIDLVGAGESIVTDYDQMVLKTALEYLQEDHEKPQFILVGTFGPHFPYITDKEMYRKYYDRVQKPEYFDIDPVSDYIKENDILNGKRKGEKVDWDIARGCLAAYCGQIEVMDRQIGTLRDAWKQYAEKQGKRQIFGYISDHGDMAGERRMYGKQVYFEKAARIPMIFDGDGIQRNQVIEAPVSLMDVGPTVCEMAGTTFEIGDGTSLKGWLDHGRQWSEEHPEEKERIVASQLMDEQDGKLYASLMLRYKNYKYIWYHDQKPLLFDLDKDPGEQENLAGKGIKIEEWLKKQAETYGDFETMERQCLENRRNANWFKIYENAAGFDDSERWKDNPPSSRGENLEIVAVDRISLVNREW